MSDKLSIPVMVGGDVLTHDGAEGVEGVLGVLHEIMVNEKWARSCFTVEIQVERGGEGTKFRVFNIVSGEATG